ncbi:interleukin-5 receptor subunit alpha isoform X1 [Mastomys coucha]|uniref:interleukin-5 receptor subunit alpha isoform X1 n=1 Tax=Mastomys coucha TaxID=35658 RepID=UPI0012621BC3|nr:interleukin-5 receptor subunit alpha isoform X1 [Mastomys coucha]XP_031238656.1 interleukin-5 receptor subunit alpha isoform X1 [Mastomys coucha]XP_031238657.1 interleukin-5 receptor subunit alpha isoform X1 [Mastomys coucha]
MMPVLLILVGASATLQVDLLSHKKFLLLPPVNFTIKATGLAQVLLHWDPNPDQEQRHVDLEYHVKINAPQEDEYDTRKTESKCVTPLHEGFAASVRTILKSSHSALGSSWVSAELKAPPGSSGTSVMNLTCTTHTVVSSHTHLRPYQVSLRCTWLVGKDAPEDTQYFLYYRFGVWTEECKEYSRDALNRNTACWFPRTPINSKGFEQLAVHINGSSKHASIKPFDQLFTLHDIDQVNPPMNVTVEIERNSLYIQWEKPLSAFPGHCFNYELKIYNTKNGYIQMENLITNKFISKIDDVSTYSIQVRAAVSSPCRMSGRWGEWSQPIYVGKERKPSVEWHLIVLPTAICFVLLIFSLLCRVCHLWTKLFPPVPAPKSNIKELPVVTEYEKPSNETKIEVVLCVEEVGFEVMENSMF